MLVNSRTFYVLLVMILLMVFQTYGHFLPADAYVLVNLILTALASYYKVNPSQNYGVPAVPLD